MVDALIGAGCVLLGMYVGQRMGQGKPPFPSVMKGKAIGSYRPAKKKDTA
jgi:hypothetical protein